MEEGVVTSFDTEEGVGLARVLSADGLPRALVHLQINAGRAVLPSWRFGVEFAPGGSDPIKPPCVGEHIRLMRNNGKALRCRVWAHGTDWDQALAEITGLPKSVRVVRLEAGEVMSVLWQTCQQTGAAAALLLSARFPRPADNSDGLSYNYHHDPTEESIQNGLAIQWLNEVTGMWGQLTDIRFPAEQLPGSLLRRFSVYK